MIFWTKFTQNRYFLVKTEQAVQGLQAFALRVVNVNSSVVFKHFEDQRSHYFEHFERKIGFLAAQALFIFNKAFIAALCT